MKQIIINICYKLISLIDFIEYKFIYNENLLDNYKTIEEINIEDLNLLIETDTGFKPLTYITKSKPFEMYNIILENGYKLSCADEHILFDDNMNELYVKELKVNDYVQTDEGPKKIVSITIDNTKVCMCDVMVNDENHRFYSNHILSHNSVVTAIYCLWKILFNIDKSGLILSKSAAAGVDLIGKIKDMFLNLPYYLKPGIYKWNQHEMAFDNNSNITTEAFSPTAGLGKTINFLILDEFAWCPNNEVELFYMNILPTITTMPDSNVCIMSTQNGFNFYYTLWKGANEEGEDWNGYAPFKVDWWQVPQFNEKTKQWEKRTEEWKRQQIGILGGEANFYYQYGTQFSASDKCIVNRTKLADLHNQEVKFMNIPGIIKYYKDKFNLEFTFGISILHPEFLYFNPNYDFSRLTKGFFIILCDLAEGGGGDSTVFNIIEMTAKDRFEQVGYWKSNIVNLELASLEFWLLMSQLFGGNEHVIYSIEWNTYGGLFFNYLMNLNEPEYMIEYSWRFNIIIELDLNNIIRYKARFEVDEGGIKLKKTKLVPGIRFNGQNKVTGCSLFKLLIENDYLRVIDFFTIAEIENFEDSNGNGSYEASYGHDDLVMTLVQLPMLQQTAKYKQFCEEFDEIHQIDITPTTWNASELYSNNYNNAKFNNTSTTIGY